MKLNTSLKLALFAVPAALLASCAPAATTGGQSVSAPEILKTPVSPVEIKPGETRYVRVDYPRSVINLGQTYFDALNIDFSNMSGNSVNSAEAYAGWLKLLPSTLPKGVNISLVSAFIVKDIDRTTQSSKGTEVFYYERFRLTYKIEVAADAPAVTDLLDLNLSDGAQQDTALLLLKVVRSVVRTG